MDLEWLFRGPDRATRRPPPKMVFSSLGLFFPYFRNFSHFLRVFFDFWAHLKPSCHFVAFLNVFFRFRKDFGKIWEGFWVDFSMIFRIFLKNADFVKYSVFLRKNHYFSYVELLKNNEKSTKNR